MGTGPTESFSGALGSGLVIFSRFPILAATMHPYSLNGSPIDVIAGDWFVGKGAASVVFAHPVLGEVQLFNTHVRPSVGVYRIRSLTSLEAIC